ncbi:MAG: DUF418 domain-containing protein [Phycisphaerae bacterium]|jgi:uncharacterized protein|nr:DUF418 domain-containing protein [Phycisphaerae bacterium]MBT5382820.1 DUF418 domain-containing protein [Phycisphaerae bacterium]MBT5583374.1 DUF418 domain-containing protein [Phycisphaerae bacterium]
MSDRIQPISLGERIDAIDVLRGVALLGILLLNVRTFALPSAAYSSPMVAGNDSAADSAVFMIVQLCADQKFMAIFSLLFGVGLVIFTTRAESRTGQSGPLHYRRMGWLLVIGLCHGWLLWWGDILFGYALCGMLVYPLRRLPPLVQFLGGVSLLLVGTAVWFVLGAMIVLGGPEVIAEVSTMNTPTPDMLVAEQLAWGGGWVDQSPTRIELAVMLESWAFLSWVMWRSAGLMLIGMACFRWGLFDVARHWRVHGGMLLVGFGVGLPLVWHGIGVHQASGWSGVESVFVDTLWNYWGSIGVAAGWIGLVLLFCRINSAAIAHTALASVGRMALSNYLAQSVLCGVIFYGWGFGYYGHFGYAEQMVVVACIWAAQLVWSPLWLSLFRFGPMEWAWRSLSYWRAQPMRRSSLHSST